MSKDELLHVLQTASESYSWLMRCNDPPPNSLMRDMGEAGLIIARHVLLTEPLEEE